MQNQNVRRNPSRDNKNIKQGQNYETHPNDSADSDKKKFIHHEDSVDSSGVPDSAGSHDGDKRPGKTQ